mmetsp:Transcript_29626/g.89135  ORF Transcript_29626/g.89135 Transcript_29626/m.89135 type:complete len:375 (-) Transcript_29626:140-1264(-)
MHRRPPRASAGFKMLPASMAPSAAPAPTNVWSSSMNKIVFVSADASATTSRSRSSNSPRYLVPATSSAISSVWTRQSRSFLGTSPSAMRCARPSAMAVLPTPGSPTRHGFDLRRRRRICTARAISGLRPTHGSSSSSRAICVRSTPTDASVVPRSSPSAPTPTREPLARRASFAMASASASTSTPSASSAARPSDASSRATANSKCSERTSSQAMASASATARLKQALDLGVKGSGSSSRRKSSAALPPRPLASGAPPPTAPRTPSAVTPNWSRAFRAFSGDWRQPKRTCSVPTSARFARRVSCCAYMSTLTASASNLSKSMRGVADVVRRRAAAGSCVVLDTNAWVAAAARRNEASVRRILLRGYELDHLFGL